MTEKQMRRKVVCELKKRGLDPISVENPVRPGTPDINYVNGWIELKTMPSWPVREDTPVRIGHFTPQQRIWLRRRCRAQDGNAWVLLTIEGEWFLVWGSVAADKLGEWTQADLHHSWQIAAREVNPDAAGWDEICRLLVEG